MANRIGWDVITHSGAGLIALVAGGLMGVSNVARGIFCVLMVVSAVSAVLISWRHDAWVAGHWLAMLPVIGIGVGFFSRGLGLLPRLCRPLDSLCSLPLSRLAEPTSTTLI